LQANEELSSDLTPGVIVAMFKTGCHRFDRSGGYAPIPVLFSSEPEQATQNIKTNPVFIRDCIKLLASKLLYREELSASQAEAYLLNPRQGQYKQPMLDSWNAAMAKAVDKDKDSSPKVSKDNKGQLY